MCLKCQLVGLKHDRFCSTCIHAQCVRRTLTQTKQSMCRLTTNTFDTLLTHVIIVNSLFFSINDAGDMID